MRHLRLCLLLTLWAATAQAQALGPPQVIRVQDSGTSCSVSGTCATFSVNTSASLSVGITGTFSGTLTFQCSTDGSTFTSLLVSNLATGAVGATTTATGNFGTGNPGCLSVRVVGTTVASGAATVTATRGYSASAKSFSGAPSTLSLADGAAGAPSIGFLNETGTGWYRVGTNTVGLSNAGASHTGQIHSEYLLRTLNDGLANNNDPNVIGLPRVSLPGKDAGDSLDLTFYSFGALISSRNANGLLEIDGWNGTAYNHGFDFITAPAGNEFQVRNLGDTNSLRLVYTSAPTIVPEAPVGANLAGTALYLQTGPSTGSATNGTLHLQAAPAGSSGSGTNNTFADVLSIDAGVATVAQGAYLKLAGGTGSAIRDNGGQVECRTASNGGYADCAGNNLISHGTIYELVSHTPASASESCTAGAFAWDASFVYICIASNTWKRVGIATW